MKDQGSRDIFVAVHQQHHHLAVALLCSMMGAGTVRMRQTGDLQIEGPHDTEASIVQLLRDSHENRIAGFIQDHKWQ
jgi:hypothetical protein